MPKLRAAALISAAVCAVLLVAGCTRSVDGRAVSIYDDPFQVAGLPTTGGPNGPRPDVPDSELSARNGDGGEVDALALNAVEDIQTYWSERFDQEFEGKFTPVTELVSWSAKASRADSVEFCTETTYRMVNAGYCRLDNSIGWDRALLLPAMTDSFGPMAVVMVLAHEYGHAIQNMAGIVARDDPVIVKEQQADCFAGAFMRYVAEGKSKHFTINTSDGLNSVLAATVAIRDSDPDDPDSVHGSAFERVTAVQIGFTDGPKGCKAIDMDEIEQRRGDLPQSFAYDTGRGEYPITKQTLIELSKALAAILPIDEDPTYSYDGAKIDCSDGTSTAPVSYCPSSNTIATDIDGLAERGTAENDLDDPLPVKVTGDYNGYLVFIARYSLAVQRDQGLRLVGAKAGLRAACLSGVVTGKLAQPGRPPSQGDITLAAGDLDEAVSGLLTDGLAASDVEGKTVPSGFARVDAFRAGVFNGEATCMSRYS
ncbi:neutral zinc metallopeptidase [Nocardia donostiensis]|uniref:Metallopeptidase n=1 Tax=Nocardia donostiensis TaxID=1538463 RepID=A0A1V2TFQ4_9NOCA|nr:neutral zinc metallopeptidase [Nocardia donostiensis]ONM48278.1 metallopeptidase [Nocardia donostiensis]OQS20612.1 metallopeptidase [Nocardia donostiensis]